MSFDADLKAIDEYIKGAALYTDAATKIRDEWTLWYDDLGWWISQESYDHGRNIRNRFNLANAITPAETINAQRVIATGITSEELAGGTKRTLSSGMYAEPLLSENARKNLALIGLAGGLAGVLWIASKIATIAKPF